MKYNSSIKIEIGQYVKYRGEICQVVYKHKHGFFNLKRPCGTYWTDVYEKYGVELVEEN